MSWFATCEIGNSSASANNYYQKHCTAFNGPVIRVTRYILILTDSFLVSYEHELIAGFTIALGFSTVLLWMVTRKAASAAQIAAEHIPRVERAYIFFDPGQIGVSTEEDGETFTTVTPTITKYGQTPGFLKKIFLEFSAIEPKGAIASYDDDGVWNCDLVIDTKIPINSPLTFCSAILVPHFTFGYIEYLDIFGQTRKSRICFKIFPASGAWEFAGGAAWNAWD